MADQKKERNVSSLRNLRVGRYDEHGTIRGGKPTEEYLNALLQQGWLETDEQRALDAQAEDMLDDRHELGLPDIGIESEEFRTGGALELVQQVKQFWPHPPTITVPTPGVGEDPENFANDLEQGLNALIEAQSSAVRGPGGRFFSDVRTQVTAFGRAYGVVLPNPRAYRGYPMPGDDKELRDPERARSYRKAVEQYGRGKLPPLTLKAIKARRVIPFWDGDGLGEAFWLETERAWEVMERAEARGVNASRLLHWVEQEYDARSALPVPVIHYANRCYRAELIGTPASFPPSLDNPDYLEDCELLGEPYPHWLENRIPMAYFPGMTTPLSDRHKQTVGVTYQLRHIITMMDRVMSMKATAVRTWAWPTPILKTSLVQASLIEAGDDGRPRPIEIVPGMVVTLWGDEELSFLTYTGQGPDQDEVIALLQRQYDRIGLPATQPSADSSGYLFAQLQQAKRGKYAEVGTGIAQGWEDLAWIELEYLKCMPGTIYIPTVAEIGWGGSHTYADARTREKSSYLRIKPEQLRDRSFRLIASIEPDKSLDMIAMGQAGNTLLPLGVPKRYIWENVLNIKNTSELKFMGWLEELEATPEYKQIVFGEALRQGQLALQEAAQEGTGALTPEELSQYSPGQIQAFVQAGLVDPAVAEQVLAMQQGNIVPGQLGGAISQGGMPAGAPSGPFMAPGGAPGMTAMQSGQVAVPGAAPPAGPLGALGGTASPVTVGPPAAPRRPAGRGRAAGQSRQPGGPQRG